MTTLPDNQLKYLLGQSCNAGSRIFVQEGIYDEFLTEFTKVTKELVTATGDPFDPSTKHGPQVSQIQFDVRIFLVRLQYS